ncbi:MAG TPA: hypothetical protein V6D10_03210 [Trichocoleus sp.]|jgi:hypothetical protein
MSTSLDHKTDRISAKRNSSIDIALSITSIKNGIWILGIPSWLFGITDRGIAAFADGYFSPTEIVQLLTASLFFLSWLYLKPEADVTDSEKAVVPVDRSDLNHPYDAYLHATQSRMRELHEKHVISQGYILPFPYVCQIYHLLNLKHLENVHSLSLGNLRIVQVSEFQPTTIGGRVKFQTMLESPMNVLRIWRQPIVEVDLILHTPYTVELSIPVYNDKRMIVLFNVVPMDDNQHKFFIDIYSDLKWPRPLLQPLLHFASCLTLFEDLPYLQKLAERNLSRVLHAGKTSNHETMLLFNRFVELYGGSTQLPQLQAASE